MVGRVVRVMITNIYKQNPDCLGPQLSQFQFQRTLYISVAVFVSNDMYSIE